MRPAEEFVADVTTVRSAFEAEQIGVWSWDIDADEMTWSSNMEAIHGSSAGSFDGTRVSFIGHIHRDDQQGVQAALQNSMRTGAAFRARYRTPSREQHDEHWLEAAGKIAAGDTPPRTMFGLCYDVTGRVNLENELRSRARQQEALAQLGERALADPGLDRLLNDAVSTVALTLSVDFVKILELLPGGIELLLRAGFGWRSDLVGTVLTTTTAGSFARHTLESAGPVLVDEFSRETRFEVPQYLVDHGCTSGMTVTILGHDGRAYGILGVCTARKRKFNTQEIAFLVAVGNILAGAIQRRQLEQRHELMIRDMRHRSGNLFSQLLALFSQTARTSKSIPDLASKYQARVLAMANAHRLITEGGWQSIPIMDLFNVVLGPYTDRATLNGPNFDLRAGPGVPPQRRAPRARRQCHKAWQPVALEGAARPELVGQPHPARDDLDTRLDREERPTGAAAAQGRLRLAAHRPRYRTAAQWRGNPHILAQGARREPRRAADTRAVAVACCSQQ